MFLIKFKLWLKKRLRRGSLLWRALERLYVCMNSLGRLKGAAGTLPDFVIIGAQKGGTTALYHYLIQHPCISSATTKEIHYFSDNSYKPLWWYRSFFPLQLRRWMRERKGKPFHTGEASTSYLLHPKAAQRAKKVLPHAKIIALLRDPVDRAFSHYKHQCRRGRETHSFEEALKLESERLAKEEERVAQDPHYYSYAFDHFSYVRRGEYAEQLQRWKKAFGEESVLAIRSEDLFDSPKLVTEKIYEFLELPVIHLKEYPPIFSGGYEDQMSDEVRKRLREHFRDINGGPYGDLCVKLKD